VDHEPRTIRSFVKLAESLSFTKAAAQLGLTQPQLSARIKGLEQQLGFELFNRTSRRVEITPGGQQFLEPARNYLIEAENLERVGVGIRRSHATRIRIGAGSCHAEVRWALLGRFMQLHPDIELTVTNFHDSAEIWAGLRSGEVDVALVVPPVPDEFDYQTISSATAGLILRADTALAQYDVVAPEMLGGQQIAIFPRRIFPTLYDQVVAELRQYDPWFSELPEPGTECVASFVRTTGVPVLGLPWWHSEADRPADIVYRGIDGHQIPLDSVLTRSRSRSSDAVNLLWRLAAKLNEKARTPERILMAANDVPAVAHSAIARARVDLSLR
jgi:DNA-binding transcriptional LysR family regulator